MKRVYSAVALLFIIMMLLSACGEPAKPLSEVFGNIKSEVTINNMNELTSVESLDKYYGIAKKDVAEFAGGINNTGVSQEEVVLIKAVDSDSANRIKTALDNRYQAKLNENKSYNPEQAKMIEKCSVEQNGLYVAMIISENADEIAKIYKSGLGL